jgi:hypothetical protein
VAVSDLKSDRSQRAKLIARVLSEPDLYPDEFKAWLPRWLGNNINFTLPSSQLPSVEVRKKVGDTGNAQFAGTWVNFGGTNESAQYMKDPWGFVHLGGVVKSGGLGTPIFVLPPGYRPEEAKIYAVASNNALGICTVNPDGTVVASSGSGVYFSLSGITFRAYS